MKLRMDRKKPMLDHLMTARNATFVVILWLGYGLNLYGQPDDALQKSELGARQRLVERKMVELENRFTAIAEKLKDKEPERHQRLVAAYQQAKEDLITRKMAEIGQLLDAGQLEPAEEKLGQVIQALDDLVRLLLNNQSQKPDRQEQIAQLEAWKKTIQQLRQEQVQQRTETRKVSNKDAEIAKLDEQLKKLDGLIDRQRGLIEQSRQAGNAGLRALDKVADRQFELRQDTRNLARDVAGEKPAAGDGRPSSPTNAESSDAAAPDRRGENQAQPAGQGQESDADSSGEPSDEAAEQPSDKPPGDASDDLPQQSQSGKDPRSGGKSGGDGSPAGQAGRSDNGNQPPQPGQAPLEKAAESQARAEEDLGSGRPADAERQQQQALQQMEQARSELKKERRRLASLPPEAVKSMARKQRRTRDKALELVEQMAEAPTQETGQDEQQVSQPNAPSQPGQQPMKQASESMQGAADDLEQQDTRRAERKQQQAQEKLDEALEELEERLNQLREETREEKLRRLEGRFREMLDRQRSVSMTTIEVDDRKVNLGQLQRRDQLVVLRMATEELEIGELGQQAYDLLLEDGTSEVFPEMVQDLRSDLIRAGDLLQQERTDQLTQLLHQEIEYALLDLLGALAESKDEGDQQGGGGGGGGGDQPLLKPSAELKMLRAAQQRLNRKTTQLDSIRNARAGQDDSLRREIEGLSAQQSKLQEMAEQIMEKEN